MNHWSEYCGHLRADERLSDFRNDTPPLLQPSLSSSSSSVTSAAMTSPCTNGFTRMYTGAHIGAVVHNGDRPALGLKKCFHCAHCRYSTDRKNNLKRHLGTMHRDHYATGATELDQSKYHVSVHRRESCRSCLEDCRSLIRRPLNRRRLATVLLDDFARTRADVGTTRNDDVNESTDQSSSPIASRSDDVSSTRPRSPSSITTESGDVSTGRVEDGTQSHLLLPIADFRNTLPPFQPRPSTAYGRHSSRMFFYDRLRSTHNYN